MWIIAVEKREPLRVGIWRLAEPVLGIAEQENRDAIAALLRCRAQDHWPTGYESVREYDRIA